jgi:E1-E2 ATPase
MTVFCKQFLSSAASFIQWTFASAAVAAAAGAIFGVCYGVALAALYGDPATIGAVVMHFLSCATAAGAILGAFVGLTDALVTRQQARDRDYRDWFEGTNGMRLPDADGPFPLTTEDLLIRTSGMTALFRDSEHPSSVAADLTPEPGLRVDDEVVIKAGQLIPADGEVVDGVALIDEGAMTGESPLVLRHGGDSTSTIVAGSRVVSGRIRVRIGTRRE